MQIDKMSILPSQLRFAPHTTYYNNFFLLRMPVTFNGQLAQVGYSGNEELTLNCRYPSINISLSMVSDKLESILRKYGVSHLVNFWCEEVLLVHTTFSSEHGLRRLLRLKEKAQDEVALLLSSELMVYVQNGKSDTTTAPLPSLPTAVEIRVFLVRPDIVKNTAQIEPVSLANHSACMALWKESEMFDFSSLFRAYRVNPSSLPDQGAVTLKVLVSELHEVVSWFGLGLQLGVPDTELLKLRHKYAICREVDECKTEVFICWMKQMKPTWSAVVRALVAIKMFSLAHKIALKYGVPVATSVETKALQAAAFSNEKQDSQLQQIEQIEKGLEAKENQAEERRQCLVKAQRERVVLKQRFSQARKNALDVHAKTTRLIDQRKKIEGQLELKQYELELLRSAEKDKQKLQKIIDSKDIEIKHLQEQLQVVNTELEVTRKEGYDFREQLQIVTKELEVKSAEVRLIERSRMELRADLVAERKRFDMLLMRRSASASGDNSTIEMENQIAALKEESESKSRTMEASISQKDAEIEKLSAHLKMIEKQLQSLLQVQQTPQPSQTEHEAELHTLVLETSELRAKLVEAEDDKQEAVRQLEIAQEQLKGYIKDEALAPPATYAGVPDQPKPTGDEEDAEFKDEGLTAVTLYYYDADDVDELSFDVHEIITEIEIIDEGWWLGTRELDESYGLFPANYVELCSPEQLQAFKAQISRSDEQLLPDEKLHPGEGKTLLHHKAVAVDEISFDCGEIITNIDSTVHYGRVKGTRKLDGSCGFFPKNCVKMYS